eukprot:scaffold232779_cov13-Tisochrysis_lutea.AAC.1
MRKLNVCQIEKWNENFKLKCNKNECVQDLDKQSESIGLKQVREGREKRFEAVRHQLEARRGRHQELHR